VIRLIAAIDTNRGVADEHGIPWQGLVPTDTEYFRTKTAEGMILMGYRTYEEFDSPMHGHSNFVATRPETSALRKGFIPVTDPIAFLHQHSQELVWVIGGAALFAQSILVADELYITQLDADFRCTKFFPQFDDAFFLASELGHQSENDISFRFEIWRRTGDPSEQRLAIH
jgi:dihydrofolate reductase